MSINPRFRLRLVFGAFAPFFFKMVSNQGERLTRVEEGLGYIKEKIDNVDRKFDHFEKKFEELIDVLRTTYAEKQHLEALEKKIVFLEKQVQSNKEFNLKVATITSIIVGAVAFVAGIIF